MKLAFSTLGMPGTPADEVARLAAATGYHGVELRAHPDEPVHVGLSPDERLEVTAAFKSAGVEILALAGYTRVGAPGPDDEVIEDLHEHLALAHDLGARYVRVFAGGGDAPAEDVDVIAARRLAAAAPRATDLGVRLLLETHDSHSRGVDVARVLGLVGHRAVGALWDVMHPWRSGEDPSATYAVLAPHLGYVQVKDIASADDTTPLPLGSGVLPLAECVELLSRAFYGDNPTPEPQEGWLSWEYEKAWYPEAPALADLLGPAREHLSRLIAESA
ncbi:sugar phosphate isomerase/epimerase family protein [Streptomyces meridianus]|uniref:Sugar phosphate isomerase/epimerase n=1 Tax=Streptomyces meridianus TaxID=2938945 RepID=A0ABT0X031_9ACTN|nr:sugar phosphate isomerase/epimerase family protein [Streptomyces meridianus]MCM2575923.1 sugar phosphate isomerase/epimerase [Streptomyces meridianus]